MPLRTPALFALAAAQLLAAAATAQRGSGSGPPTDRSTPVQANELRESWNGRVSAGPRVGASPEFEGWSMGHAMLLARSEHGVVEMAGKVWVLGGDAPRRLPSDLVQVYDPAAGRWSLGPRLPQPIHHIIAAAVGGKLYVIGGEIDGASTGGINEVMARGRFHVWGGEDVTGMIADHDYYDPRTDKWARLRDMPIPVHGVGGSAYVGGAIWGAGRGTNTGGGHGSVHHQTFRPAVSCE
jgi:hypothetical protein